MPQDLAIDFCVKAIERQLVVPRRGPLGITGSHLFVYRLATMVNRPASGSFCITAATCCSLKPKVGQREGEPMRRRATSVLATLVVASPRRLAYLIGRSRHRPLVGLLNFARGKLSPKLPTGR